ncbi:hypothetical protein EON81_21050 [bacterium]|nr:MAG: hypothetical protein EON81_21050 [bacterium]
MRGSTGPRFQRGSRWTEARNMRRVYLNLRGGLRRKHNESMRLLPFLPLLLPVFGCAQTQAPVSTSGLPSIAPGRYERTIMSGGLSRKFILHVPKAYDGSKPVPMVVVLHGWGGSGASMEGYSGMADEAEKRGYVSVFPDGLGKTPGWNAGFIDLSFQKKDDIGFVGELMTEVEKQVGIDSKRIYVCGHSNGAFLTNAVGAKYGDKLAAIGAVAGTIGLPKAAGVNNIPTPPSKLSVIAIHGRLDPVVGYGGTGAVQAMLQGVGALDAATWWAEKLGAIDPKTTDADGVETKIWRNLEGYDVELVSLATAKHDWPGSLSRSTTPDSKRAEKILMDFFDAHVKKG